MIEITDVNDPKVTPETVTEVLNHGALHYTMGMRGFYLAVPTALWLFGPVWLLHRQLQTYHFNDIMASLQAIPISRIWKAFGLTLASYGVMTGYDALALRYIQHPLTYFKIALASFIGCAFSNNIGLSMIAGGLGVFETVVVLLLSSQLPAPRILGALLIYRVLYYWMPLVAAALMLGIQEILRKLRVARRIAELFEQWVSPIIPQVLAVTVFVGGAILLLSGATPVIGQRLEDLRHYLPLPFL